MGEECVCALRSAAVLYLAAVHQRNLPPLFFTIGTEAMRSALAPRLHQSVFTVTPGSHAGVTVLARIHLTNLELEIKTRDIPKIRNSFRDTFRSGPVLAINAAVISVLPQSGN